MWFPTRSDTNRPVQSQKRARSMKFRILVEEELFYPSSENKDADQLRGYREADLRLCFRLCRLLVFPCGSSFKHCRLRLMAIEAFSDTHTFFWLPWIYRLQDMDCLVILQHAYLS